MCGYRGFSFVARNGSWLCNSPYCVEEHALIGEVLEQSINHDMLNAANRRALETVASRSQVGEEVYRSALAAAEGGAAASDTLDERRLLLG